MKHPRNGNAAASITFTLPELEALIAAAEDVDLEYRGFCVGLPVGYTEADVEHVEAANAGYELLQRLKAVANALR